MKRECLPHIIAVMSFVVFIVLGLACATVPTKGPYKPATKDEKIIGSIKATFEAMQGYGGAPAEKDEIAYNALLEVARTEYQGNIDVRNVTWTQGKHISGVKTAVFAVFEYNASGNVVQLGVVSAANMESALENAAKEISGDFPTRSRVAIVYITAQDRSLTEYISGELEHLLRRQGCIIIDRSELDRVRAEQQFGVSGEVDDNTAASIGQFAGASIVITGRIDGEGDLRRLRLRALDTTSGQVVGTASERL